MKLTYKVAGVDIDAADAVVKKIGQLAKSTHRNGVLGGIGLFGGFFELDLTKYRNPVLVSSVDGVGTKIKIACAMEKYRGIGVDLVNHCVNDVMCCGAEPLYFLDYLSLGKIDGKAVLELAEGLADGCVYNQCALIGGETAEMPDLYEPGEFDIAGTLVGIVEKENIIDGSRIESGDILLGLKSSGLHTNGYTLARRIIELSSESGYHTYYPELGMTVGDALLAEHRSYFQAISAVQNHTSLHGISHITGGGIEGNTKRLLKEKLSLRIAWDAWEVPAIFSLLHELGNVDKEEMQRVFNLGIGLVLIVSKSGVNEISNILNDVGDQAAIIGKIA
jgi:phosphoribosylformylglycinamidine cyclo-ligase